MAEITAKKCIAVLHNNQYQKHIGNCEYWNRTYNQCEEPELIERYGGTGNSTGRGNTCDKWKGVK